MLLLDPVLHVKTMLRTMCEDAPESGTIPGRIAYYDELITFRPDADNFSFINGRVDGQKVR